MKTLLLCAMLGLSSFTAHAGNWFGAAPFRNGSPLPSGVDGSYQATVRAENVTGIFRFAYSGGSQTSDIKKNSWIFFVNGNMLRGTVDANLNQSELNGILDNTAVSTSTNASALPIIITSGGVSTAAGNFQGTLDLKSPSGAFSGTGNLLPAPASTNVLTIIANAIGYIGTNPYSYVASTVTKITNAQGSLAPIRDFRFRGVRTSTSATGVTTTTASSTGY